MKAKPYFLLFQQLNPVFWFFSASYFRKIHVPIKSILLIGSLTCQTVVWQVLINVSCSSLINRLYLHIQSPGKSIQQITCLDIFLFLQKYLKCNKCGFLVVSKRFLFSYWTFEGFLYLTPNRDRDWQMQILHTLKG